MNELRSLVGKPWAIPCDPPNNFECFELMRHVRGLLGIETPTIIDRANRTDADYKNLETLIQQELPHWHRVEPTHGCVVLMGKRHCGVYLHPRMIIHVSNPSGVRIDSLRVMNCIFKLRFMEWNDAKT